ncbi:MAG TPA: adenylate/guanylate cyclase domain-containing protein [Stellaceae bacterium]|nr:adenylate/guanylate cyclase domain-containing protein [Stellaceae bacterium]
MDDALFAAFRQSTDRRATEAIERLVSEGPDKSLSRINAIAFAASAGLGEEAAIGALLHATKLGIFDLAWNVLCPGCGGVLNTSSSLKSVDREEYRCSMCASDYEPTLDEIVEVTFTVSPRVRRIPAHNPDELPLPEYFRQVFWGSFFDIPDQLEEIFEEVTLDSIELPAGERATLSLQLPPQFLILFDPVTHAAQFLDVKGEPTRERQSLSLVLSDIHSSNETVTLRPGPLRLALENRAGRRTLPGVWVANDTLHALLGRRRPFLTAKRLLTNQTFRDLYRTDTLDLNQRLKITSLTFMFTDLRGSTGLYDRVGDLAAYDIVQDHFRVLQDIVASQAGAVVKTIGDAVMATFPTPGPAVAAALRMREAMGHLAGRHNEDLLLKIGIHEGPCLAVMLNERQDYFGQTVNIASRVQSRAASRAILATGAVVENGETAAILAANGLTATPSQSSLRGIADPVTLYEIP